MKRFLAAVLVLSVSILSVGCGSGEQKSRRPPQSEAAPKEKPTMEELQQKLQQAKDKVTPQQ